MEVGVVTHGDAVTEYQAAQGLGQVVKLRHRCPGNKDRNDTPVGTQRRLDLDADVIPWIIESAEPIGGGIEPLGSDDDQYGVRGFRSPFR